jgi:hypothetical protein
MNTVTAPVLSLLLLGLFTGVSQDLDEVLAKADQLFAQAKEGYESGKLKGSAEQLTAAAFKLEEARSKYLALQEIAGGERKQVAVDRLKNVNQLSKLISEAKLLLTGKPTNDPPPKPPADPPPPPPPAPPAPPPVKAVQAELLPVPDAGRQREAEKSIKELFKTEYARRTPQETQTLARKLLALGTETQDEPAARFVFLREARDLSTQVGDFETALAAISTMGQWFQIEVISAKSLVLSKSAATVRTPEASFLLARAYLALIEEAVQAGQFDAAAGVTGKAEAAAKASGDPPLAIRASAVAKDVTHVQREAGAVKPHRKTLEEKPDDPAANGALGRFYCLAVGDWDRGLPYLVKGVDADLKAFATRDLAGPTEPVDMTALGDSWWDHSEKESNATVKRRLKNRAWFWYRKALPAASGLSRVRMESRLREAGGFIKPNGKPTRSTVIVGGTGGGDFEDIGKDNQILVGFKFTVTSIIKSIQPVFYDGTNRTDGRQYGKPSGAEQEIVAKPGYAVAGIVARGGTRVDGFKVVFMRVAGPGLDPRDSYTSKWLGGSGGGDEMKIGGDGGYVLGIHGRSADDLDCLGLVIIK